MLLYGKYEYFGIHIVYVCALCASCGSSQSSVLHDLQFVNGSVSSAYGSARGGR